MTGRASAVVFAAVLLACAFVPAASGQAYEVAGQSLCRAVVLSVPRAVLAVDCQAVQPDVVTVWIGSPALPDSRLWKRLSATEGRPTVIPLDRVALAAALADRLTVEVTALGMRPFSWRGVADKEVDLFGCGMETGRLCGIWSQVLTPEICNGADDDCNGLIDDDAPCADDGVACTVEACLDGGCASTPTDSLCYDGRPCTIDACNAQTGCSHTSTCTGGNTCCGSGCVDVTSDVQNCGACGILCSYPNATAGCTNSQCRIAYCNPGFGDCDAIRANGCEIDLTSSVTHCGACGRTCPSYPYATPSCTNSQCGIGSCYAGWADCDRIVADGCEINVTSNVTHCGACGRVCPGYQQPGGQASCSYGQCAFSCVGESYDCNASASDGCEIADTNQGYHSQSTSLGLGSFPCTDSQSNPNITGLLPSDARAHILFGSFDAASGSAPDWYRLQATGGLTCSNDVYLNLSVAFTTGCGSCYRLAVFTDRGTYACSTVSGSCVVSRGSGSYSNNSTIYIAVDKTCSVAQCTGPATYSVSGHL